MFNNVYNGKKVLVTGHTGFKGSWLCLWLHELGAQVSGYSLPPVTSPNHAELLNIKCISILDDIRDAEKLRNLIQEQQPEVIFHLAAQPFVRRSYREPIETFTTNIIGTLNLLETCRASFAVKAVIVVTSDKCYENRDQSRGYVETDSLGGYDPYSASKGCAELVVSSYRQSFFPVDQFGTSHETLLATARAGNVIGGGDWGEDRLVPDIMNAASKAEPVSIRNPGATRPWQHVLESLSGYLMLGQKLLEGRTEFAQAWNFGPGKTGNIEVRDIVHRLQEYWSRVEYRFSPDDKLHEANFLQLDCSKARSKLGWRPVWELDEALKMTALWYRHFYEDGEVMSKQQLAQYVESARQRKLAWVEA